MIGIKNNNKKKSLLGPYIIVSLLEYIYSWVLLFFETF